MKFLATLTLILAPPLAQAQSHVYEMKIVLGGVTYQGQFVWMPNTVGGCVGPTPQPGPGIYSDVSISDPPVTLTSAADMFTAADCLTYSFHEIWFSTPGGTMPFYPDPAVFQLDVIPGAALGGASVPITAVTVYRLGQTIAECSPCSSATLTEVPVSANGTTVPAATPLAGAASTPQIVDSQHNLWTLTNGKVIFNGITTPSSGVLMMLYSGGVVYQENIHHDWWKWVGGKWVVDTSAHTGYSCPAP